MYAEGDLLPLSGLQHLAFCERQWGLIHIEQAWEENRLTAEGRLLHERADEPEVETRPGVRIVRALSLRSLRLGLSGRADVVEFPRAGCTGAPAPVEYKRGKPKDFDWDEVQLCAQGLCLEEMLGASIPSGALYYGLPRRRTEVEFTAELRLRVETLSRRMHELFALGVTPPPRFEPKCRQCSLEDVCQPKLLSRADPWQQWRRLLLRGTE